MGSRLGIPLSLNCPWWVTPVWAEGKMRQCESALIRREGRMDSMSLRGWLVGGVCLAGCTTLPWSLTLVVVYKHICPLSKSLSPSVLCCRYLGPYLMFYYLDSSHLIKCVCFYISNLFTALPQDALSFVCYCSQWLLYLSGAWVFFHLSLTHCNLSWRFLWSIGEETLWETLWIWESSAMDRECTAVPWAAGDLVCRGLRADFFKLPV